VERQFWQHGSSLTLTTALLLACAYGFSKRFTHPATKSDHGSDDEGQDIETLTDAEWLLMVGNEARARLQQGESLDSIARRHQLRQSQIQAAMAFAASSSGVVLRTLIESIDP